MVIPYRLGSTPVQPQKILAEKPHPALERHEEMWLRAAAVRAKAVYPGAVGELVAREILTWAEFAHRLDQTGLVMRVARQVMTGDAKKSTPH